VAYLHNIRRGDRCPDLWNQACDHVINLQLIARGFKMPQGGLADPQYEGMSAEEVYELLQKNPGKPMPKAWMDLDPDTILTPDQAAGIQRQVEDILVHAALQSQMANDTPGTIPGEIEIFLDKLRNPKLPWQKIVQKYLQAYNKNDYTYKKPNRRYFPTYHLPSLWSQTLIDLAIAIDVSGSIDQDDFMHFVTETHSLMRMMKPNKVSLIQFDTEIKSVDEIESIMDLMRVKFTGGGGTDIHPVLDWANANKPQLLLVFTDGEFGFAAEAHTKSDTLWIVHDDPNWKAPFGKVVHYSMDKHR
jgi:predicted metal-dependent peptidase